ncbi:MAG TPA: hypothetical protein VGK48_21370 [Terriglobia bacterium]|jgi:hypothetical protein
MYLTKSVALIVAAASMSAILNGAPADLAVTGSMAAQMDPKTASVNCHLTRSGGTLFHYGAHLQSGKATGLGSKFLSVVFEIVPYNGSGKYDAAVKVAGDTPVEVTLHTEGIPGIQEKWLTTSGSVVISSASGQAVSGTVEADLSSTQKKSGAIHLAGTWSCKLDL